MTAGTEQVSSWDSGARLALGSQGVQALSRVCCTHHLVVIYSVSSPSNELMLKVATLRDTTFLRPCRSYHSLAVHDERNLSGPDFRSSRSWNSSPSAKRLSSRALSPSGAVQIREKGPRYYQEGPEHCMLHIFSVGVTSHRHCVSSWFS